MPEERSEKSNLNNAKDTARVLDALRQLVNLGAAFLRDAAIVKEGLGQSFAQRDGARDLVGDERRLKTLSQLNLLGSHACFEHRTTLLRTLRANDNCGWSKVSRLTSAGADPARDALALWREMPARAPSASIGPAEGRGKTGGTGVLVRHGAA